MSNKFLVSSEILGNLFKIISIYFFHCESLFKVVNTLYYRTKPSYLRLYCWYKTLLWKNNTTLENFNFKYVVSFSLKSIKNIVCEWSEDFNFSHSPHSGRGNSCFACSRWSIPKIHANRRNNCIIEFGERIRALYSSFRWFVEVFFKIWITDLWETWWLLQYMLAVGFICFAFLNLIFNHLITLRWAFFFLHWNSVLFLHKNAYFIYLCLNQQNLSEGSGGKLFN